MQDELRPTVGEEELDPDPLVQFHRWYLEAGSDEMALSTVSDDGAPSSRMVLLKEHGPAGFVFYSDYASAKARQLRVNPRAALLFRWPPLRQVRVVGHAEKVERPVTEAYWTTRERESQLSAWASAQSRPLHARADLEEAVAEARRRFAGEAVPCPPDWGGYRVLPDEVEFWQQGQHRRHDRIRYFRLEGKGGREPAWGWERLFP